MAKTSTPKVQTAITEPTARQTNQLVKTYANNGMKCYKVDGVYILKNTDGQTIAKKNSLQDIDDEQMLY